MKHVVIIGAGLGGLSAALHLAHQGFRVTMFEKNERVGGKMGRHSERGYSFDTGPTLLTMPFVVTELFQRLGCSSPPFELRALDPVCRYRWQDGSMLEARSDTRHMAAAFSSFTPADGEAFLRFLQHGERLYRSAVETFLFHPISSLRFIELIRYARLLPRVFFIDPLRTYEQAIAAFFTDYRTQQFFHRFATYNGSSPYETPATMAVIPYIELKFGGWYIMGGMYRLAEAMQELALRNGVAVSTGTEVRKILVDHRRACGVQLLSGEIVEADAVLTNADAEYTQTALLELPRRERQCRPSLSGLVMLLGVRKQFRQLGHHTILFSKNYRAEFDALFRDAALPEDPTIYICNSSASDATQAPQGCSNLFVMVNAPPLTSNGRGRVDWTSEIERYRAGILKKMEHYGFTITEEDVEVEHVITPHDFEQQLNAAHGAIYGQASNSPRSAFLRPPNRSRTIKGLYCAGGTVHPGGGIPLVLLSGMHAANLIRQDLCG